MPVLHFVGTYGPPCTRQSQKSNYNKWYKNTARLPGWHCQNPCNCGASKYREMELAGLKQTPDIDPVHVSKQSAGVKRRGNERGWNNIIAVVIKSQHFFGENRRIVWLWCICWRFYGGLVWFSTVRQFELKEDTAVNIVVKLGA